MTGIFGAVLLLFAEQKNTVYWFRCFQLARLGFVAVNFKIQPGFNIF